MPKIIPVFKFTARPSTQLMMRTLKAAFIKQIHNAPIAQKDLHGSFMGLLKRALIDCKRVTIRGNTKVWWYVIPAGSGVLNEYYMNLVTAKNAKRRDDT